MRRMQTIDSPKSGGRPAGARFEIREIGKVHSVRKFIVMATGASDQNALVAFALNGN